ncbi:transient receptor potential cation channel subfamily A member 1 homolog isoform X1 [Saccostrea echinata]|uniref:transient receptor potential cation channel subfamily A member 1 homolog isoform X1 n=2 Tax=Saccostrea echinata TaxID=191078 RepID=UPI002A83AA92|nr:transient receptor potential cation channel subfamily A member 1 homolog isoform X1 [Saccostrea echinata]
MDDVQGSYRTTVSVTGPDDEDEKKANGVEMKNLLDDEEEPQVVPSGMKRSDTADLLNLTLHQCARNGDTRSMEILLKSITGNVRKKINMRDEEGVTAMHYAARYNQYEIVKLLHNFGADINSLDEEALTPLHYAARYKREKQRRGSELVLEDREMNAIPSSQSEGELAKQDVVVIYLIKNGADMNRGDKYGLTPLHYAAMRGNELATKELLQFEGINIEAEDKQGMTALHMAATHNHVEIARMLINAGAQLRCKDNEDLTPLHCAASEGNIEIVQLLFQAGAKQDGWVTISNMVTDRDCDQNTCLHLAVENGHYDVVKLCLEKRSDVNTPSSNYMYPLHLAAKAGDIRCVKLLVRNHARIDALNDEMATPLHIAAGFNHKDVVEFLIEMKAPMEKRDRDNYTPLLMAAYSGHAESLDALLKKGADYEAVDKNDKTAVYLAAEEDKLEALKTMLAYPDVRRLVDVGDRYDNHPLHIAAQEGYLGIVRCLIENGADLDCKNEEEQTPLHLAAKNGRTNVVREMVIRDHSSVNDEDEDSNTALHLATLHGHTKVAMILIKNGADVAARNSVLWTPLDCAAAKGWLKTVKCLLDADAQVDPMDKTKTTPLHLASRYGHADVVKCLLEHNANVSQRDTDGNNCLDLAIDNNKTDVASVIINSDKWEEAMRNETPDIATGLRTTPMRKLIKKMPDVAEEAFLRCMTTNNKNPEHPDYKCTFNYEFLDDTYSNWTEGGTSEGSGSGSVYNEDFTLNVSARPYTSDSSELKNNHPLIIMVNSKREDLLAHPLVNALLRHKWNSFGRTFYYINFLIYAIFLVFLTGYVVQTDPPFEVYEELKKNDSSITSSTPEKTACEKALTLHDPSKDMFDQPLFATIGKYVIMGLAAWNLLRELLQIYQAKLQYLGFENLIEWVTYVCALLLVIDFESCQKSTGFRFTWQWSVGAVAIFLCWINLVLFLQKFPRFGIYVVMFKDILNTFMQFAIVFFLFIVAFGLGFYCLLQSQDAFATVWESLIKTTVMMIGEYEYENIFYGTQLDYYPEITYIMFVVFMILMSIIIMNLLVGLAVDDIKAVQEQAALKRMAMQVDLALDVERVVPEFIRRRFVAKCDTYRPNRKTLNPLKLLARAEAGDLSSQAISKALDPDLDEIEKVMETQEKLQKDMSKLKGGVKNIREQSARLEGMLRVLLEHSGVTDFNEEDFQDRD